MRHHRLAALFAAMVFVVATAFAEQHTHSGATTSSRPGTSTKADDLDVEAIEGVVARVDARTGALVLRTDTGSLTMHVPPRWVAKVKPGDHLKVSMALDPPPAPAHETANQDKKTLAWLLLMLREGRGAR